LSTQDQTAADKMEELAKKFNLIGYENSDQIKIFSLYQQNAQYISFAIVAFSIFLMSALLYLKRKKQRAIFPAVALIIILVAFAIHINLDTFFTSGIISSPHTYIMSGPSSGADIVAVIDEGNRFDLMGKNDVWLKIDWNGETAFVKENNVLKLNF